ncbi:hypothetical protein ACLIBH_09070 [Virgibacillus sp. W0430]|uniref:hypothetical protein n=1 Tax=Virgibacillus sp. W0430 TaxID=3391580 RepID=UPI003F470A3C
MINSKKKTKWANFAGQSTEKLCKQFEHILCNQQILFKKQTYLLPALQALFLGGGNKGTKFIIGDNADISVTFIPAFADPMTKLIFSFTSTEKKINDMKNVSVIELHFNKNNETVVKQLMNNLNATYEQPLWNISHHPRFQTGIFLAARIRKKWDKWVK